MSISVEVLGSSTAEVDAVLGPTADVAVTVGPSTQIDVVGSTPGPAGPAGPPGPTGPPGPGSGAYVHVQSVPSALWIINHGLTYTPNVTVVDSAGDQVEGDVTIIGGTISVGFSGAFAGTAYLS